MYPIVRIKKNKGASIQNRHPWIFSGALEKPSKDIQHGDFVRVEFDGRIIATGMFSRHSMIMVRAFAFDDIVIDKDWLLSRIRIAARLRRDLGLFTSPDTTACRIIYGQSDSLPGLVVDKYNDVLVMQISTAGMEGLKDRIIACLIDEFSPRCIYERSDLASRAEEKLPERVGVCYGDSVASVEFKESGRRYIADIETGQKTGFYLDQRELRNEIQRLAAGRKAVDIFSYSGAAGIAALAGGADSVEFVDSSAPALESCRRHTELNEYSPDKFTATNTDVFQWIAEKKTPEYDLIMLDPPALIKSRKYIESGKKAYHFLNRAALRMGKDSAILVTSSCSAYLTDDVMLDTLRRAANQSGIEVQLLKTIRQSPDHPVPLNFPEAHYLKSFICSIKR